MRAKHTPLDCTTPTEWKRSSSLNEDRIPKQKLNGWLSVFGAVKTSGVWNHYTRYSSAQLVQPAVEYLPLTLADKCCQVTLVTKCGDFSDQLFSCKCNTTNAVFHLGLLHCVLGLPISFSLPCSPQRNCLSQWQEDQLQIHSNMAGSVEVQTMFFFCLFLLMNLFTKWKTRKTEKEMRKKQNTKQSKNNKYA